MCQSTVYARRGEGQEDEVLLEEVTRLVVADGEVSMTTLFGEPLTVSGRIQEIDLTRQRVILDCA